MRLLCVGEGGTLVPKDIFALMGPFVSLLVGDTSASACRSFESWGGGGSFCLEGGGLIVLLETFLLINFHNHWLF